tara:strand:- start:679 stop:1458 length:780 start_codon:yes stop_codon:yes gene_type:complete
MDFGINGKKVLITGGSKGIGRAIAKAFAAEGSEVILVARKASDLKNVVDEIGGKKQGHSFFSANLLEKDAPIRTAKELLEKHRNFDIVVHNVGGALGIKDPIGPMIDWEKVWRFNVGISIDMNSLLVPSMRRNGWGRIIHISSVSAMFGELRLNPYGGSIPYAASKSYLNAYVRGLGRELADQNIVVSAIMPGAIISEGKYWDILSRENPKLVKQYLEEHHSVGRFGKAEEIAPFVVMMASEQASFACGSILPIDGGRI